MVASTDMMTRDKEDEFWGLESEHWQIFEQAGRLGQSINTIFPLNRMGVCAIGYVETDLMRDAMDLKSEEFVVYSFLGGMILEEQTQTWDNNLESTTIILQHRLL